MAQPRQRLWPLQLWCLSQSGAGVFLLFSFSHLSASSASSGAPGNLSGRRSPSSEEPCSSDHTFDPVRKGSPRGSGSTESSLSMEKDNKSVSGPFLLAVQHQLRDWLLSRRRHQLPFRFISSAQQIDSPQLRQKSESGLLLSIGCWRLRRQKLRQQTQRVPVQHKRRLRPDQSQLLISKWWSC